MFLGGRERVHWEVMGSSAIFGKYSTTSKQTLADVLKNGFYRTFPGDCIHPRY